MVEEKDIETRLVKAVKKKGGLAIKLASPGYAGLPDRLILMHNARVAFVEVKAKGQKPRRLQIKRHEELRRLGFKVYVLDDEEKIGGIVDEIYST